MNDRTMRVRAVSVLFVLAVMITLCGRPAYSAVVKLCNPDGSLYRTVTVSAGSRKTFPALYFPDKTFCGWAYKERGKVVKGYAAGEVIPNAARTYYVMANTMGGVSALPARKMLKPKMYARVFIIGDSRTKLMKHHLSGMVKKTRFIFKDGSGVGWLKSAGMRKLKKALVKRKKKTAVVFNMGVNDLHRVNTYIAFYKKIAKGLRKKNCDLYIASVNPIDVERMVRMGWNRLAVSAADVVKFNRKLRAGTRKYYTWIDTYDYLMRDGWTSGCSGKGDGLHYTKGVYQRIYNYIIAALNSQK